MLVPVWFAAEPSYADGPIPWAAYYARHAPEVSTGNFKILVLDSDYGESLGEFLEDGKTVLAYLSIGELSEQRPYFRDVRRDGYLLEENRNWPGSYKIDVRDRRWTERIIQDLIPQFLRNGFSGVFIDTLDSAVDLENRQPHAYRGMRAAASRVVQTIRQNYPKITIMVNRGYELVPDFAADIDYIVGESVYTTYDFSSKTYTRKTTADVQSHISLLQSIKEKYSKIGIMTLDYWDTDDVKEVSTIYRAQYENGFSPYVASIELDRVIPEPKER
jgi:uncharacterized protein (TIGR01370 family)